MKKENWKIKINKRMKLATILIMIAILLWSLTSGVTPLYKIKFDSGILNQGFTQIINDKEIPLENISDFQDMEKGETLVITTIIPQLNCDNNLYKCPYLGEKAN